MQNLELSDLEKFKQLYIDKYSFYGALRLSLVAGRIELKHCLILGYFTLSVVVDYCRLYDCTFVMSSSNSLTIYRK